jgi:hypothetical protein
MPYRHFCGHVVFAAPVKKWNAKIDTENKVGATLLHFLKAQLTSNDVIISYRASQSTQKFYLRTEVVIF